ncbi:glycosyl hydrolase family 61-domain-containing protein [Melanogaster broomeanus]|nr:glycosyl hydrolase family 61-domain-containing protein [Melanogaster broomeanus]
MIHLLLTFSLAPLVSAHGYYRVRDHRWDIIPRKRAWWYYESQCHKTAADVANANPGSQLQVHWVGGSTVGTNRRVVQDLRARCRRLTTRTWYQANIMAGQPANVTIPSNIISGEYLLRSELIALQQAMSLGGAEFYLACIQLNIGGSGTGAAASSEECTFPGCYSDTDPGIYDPTTESAIGLQPAFDLYSSLVPPVAAFVGGGRKLRRYSTVWIWVGFFKYADVLDLHLRQLQVLIDGSGHQTNFQCTGDFLFSHQDFKENWRLHFVPHWFTQTSWKSGLDLAHRW